MLLMIILACLGGLDRDLDAGSGDCDEYETPFNDVDDDCDSLTLDDDGDQDGVSKSYDCNDKDSSIYPDAEETWYDGVDQNCDGLDDYDQDGDGHKTDDVDGGDDCLDTDEGVHPGATDTWYDGIDQDCDERDDFDQDGDGGASSEHGGTDCDDLDETVYAGADEICDDGIVNDCNGYSADAWAECGWGASSSPNVADVIISGGSKGDALGFDMSPLDDGRILISAPNPAIYDGTSTGEGAVYLLQGTLPSEVDLSIRYDSSAGTLPHYVARIAEENPGDELGWEVKGAPDLNGDSRPEVFIAGWSQPGNDEIGVVYLIDGSVSGDVNVADPNFLIAKIVGESSGDRFGSDIAVGTDGTGGRFVAIGAPSDDSPASEGGSVYILDVSTLSGTMGLAGAANARWASSDSGAHTAWAIGVGDVDADGSDDVLVGTQNKEPGGAYLVTDVAALTSGVVTLESIAIGMSGDVEGDQFGYPLSMLGDLDGDGYEEMTVSAWFRNDQEGAVYIFDYNDLLSTKVGGDRTKNNIAHFAPVKIYGEQKNTQFGSAVSSIGDVNQDGEADLLVAARLADNTWADAGSAYLFLGPLEGGDVSENSSLSSTFKGTTSGGYLGDNISSAGDMNSDGFPDFLIGELGADNRAGRVYLFYGAPY